MQDDFIACGVRIDKPASWSPTPTGINPGPTTRCRRGQGTGDDRPL